MDLPLDAITLPSWDPATEAELDAAFEKVENYLRACRVASRLHRARLAALIVQRALARRAAPTSAAVPLETLAIQEARAVLAAWLDHLLPPRADGPAPTPAEGLVALYLCDGPLRWPQAFLTHAPIPPEFTAALQTRAMQAGPELQISHMVPRPMDIGLLPGLAGNALGSFEKFPLLKLLVSWALFVALLAALFWYTRSWRLP